MIGKLGIAIAALALLAAPARAEDAAPAPDAPCPNIYGVWETAFLVGASRPWDSTPEPLAPGRWWGGLLMKVYIDKDKAALVWMKDHAGNKSSAIYKRFFKYGQSDYDFNGMAASGATISAHVIQGKFRKTREDFACLLILGEYDSDKIGARIRQDLIMRKVR